MLQYIIGIISAFAATILHGWANIFDNHFSNVRFKNIATLVFTCAVCSLIFLPIVCIIDFPHFVPLQLLPYVLIIAAIEVLYLYPYYWSLRHTDTSVVISLFSMGKILVPILAFLFVGEKLASIQYLGFFLIILASVFLTLNLKKLQFNKAFYLMLFASLILSVQSVIYKSAFQTGISWGTIVVWGTIFQVIFSSIPLLLKKNRIDVIRSVSKIKKMGWMFVFAEFLSWGGEAAHTYAVFLIPVSIVKGITSTQSVFVLFMAMLFMHKMPHLFKEYLGTKGLAKKITLFSLIIIGTILVTFGS